MLKRTMIALAVALSVMATAASVQAQPARTLDAFVTEANRIPMNPVGLLLPSARRLGAEVNAAFDVIALDIRADRAAGRPPVACPPERMQLNPRQMLSFLNAIPQSRRARMSVTDGIRLWMADRYPC